MKGVPRCVWDMLERLKISKGLILSASVCSSKENVIHIVRFPVPENNIISSDHTAKSQGVGERDGD